jgi:ribose transport system ATP-binding protein
VTPPLVRMTGIRKSFVGVVALDAVDFELRAGEIHGLAGENGSGKSTLVKILYGAHQPDDGTIEIDGVPTTFASPRRAIELGIVAISQELTLAPTLTVAENILMGRLPRHMGVLDWPAANRAATEALESLGVHVDPRARLGDLSIELQQEVEVARAVSADSRVLVLDEATSSLSEAATERLLERIEQLRSRGVAIVFISHRLRELYACCSRVTVLRDGRLIDTATLADTDERSLVRMMVGREITDLYDKREIPAGEPLLSVSGLTTEDLTVRDASFDVRAGEIVGVAGLVGCGKSELALALGGAIRADGEVRLRSRRVRLRSPRAAIAAGIGLVPEDRKRSAILPTRTVQQNLSAAWGSKLSRAGVLNVAEERRMAQASLERFGVRTPSLATPIVQLSGGNQQKVVLGRWFALSPDVIVLSEPTRGIDVGAKSEVYRLIQDMAEEGAGVLMISSELPELLGLSDRVLVMFRGRIEATLARGEATEEEIASIAFGHGVAEAVA